MREIKRDELMEYEIPGFILEYSFTDKKESNRLILLSYIPLLLIFIVTAIWWFK